jgi:putative two-component system response regulator
MPNKIKVLYVEDNDLNRLLVRRILEPLGYEVHEANDGIAGVKMAQELEPDLILMDINLPLLDGHAAATRIKSMERLAHIPIVAVTANVRDGDRERSLVAGCDGYIKKPIDVEDFPKQIMQYIGGAKDEIGHEDQKVFGKEYNEKLVRSLERHIEQLEIKTQMIESQSKEMEQAYMDIIISFLKAVEEKHSYTAGHSARVRAYSMKIGEKLRLSMTDMERLSQGAILHDIGKLVIEISSLKNITGLTDDEWKKMREHAEIGYKILKQIKFLCDVVNIVHQHHEHWDGSGYPQGLVGNQIDFLASIVAVADSYDAMTTNRGYNQPLTIEEAKSEFRQCAGTHFNPVVVEAFVLVLDDMKKRQDKIAGLRSSETETVESPSYNQFDFNI